MTPAARMLLVVLASLGFVTAFLPSEPLVLLLLCGILYLAGGWLRLLWWAHGLSRRTIEVERRIAGKPDGPLVLSPGDEIDVELEFRAEVPPLGVHLRVDEVLPPGATVVSGRASAEGSPPLVLRYRLAFDHAGPYVLPGALVRFADAAGLFEHESFHADRLEVEVLPVWMAAVRIPSATKIENRLLPIGIHRHPRRGVGAELLQLRDYVAGDPPRSIAWKASARRDRLITRDFESEVTIRTRVFLDASDSMRIGRAGGSALDRAAGVVAGLVAAVSEARDPVGLTLFEGSRERTFAPGLGASHLAQVVRALADVAGRPPDSTAVDLVLPFEAAWKYAQIVYADELDPAVNPEPRGLLLPFTGRPVWKATLRDRLRAFVSPATILRSIRERKRLATLLAAWSDLPPAAVERFRHDDAAMSRAILAFAAAHGLRVPYSVLGPDGRYAFAEPAKLDRLASAVGMAFARARDQELYAIYVDLVGLGGDLGSVLDVLAQCRARHHRVLVFTPVEAPAAPEGGDAALAALYTDLLGQEREACRLAFARIGVPLLPLAEGDSVRTVLAWLARLKSRREIRA